MAKRKEYMEEAERCAFRLFAIYFREHNKEPNDSVIKSAMTKAKSIASDKIYHEVRKRIGTYDRILGVGSHPDFDNVLKQIFKEIEEDVDNFRLRQ